MSEASKASKSVDRLNHSHTFIELAENGLVRARNKMITALSMINVFCLQAVAVWIYPI